MTSEEAKSILVRFRPGSRDGEDRAVAEALRLAKSDPELGSWFQAQSESQQAIRARFREIPVPAGLRDQILAQRKTLRPAWPFRAELVLLAASLVLLLAATAFWLAPRRDNGESFADFRLRMTQFALREYRMDILSQDPIQVRNYLAAKGGPADFQLPKSLKAASVKGGGKLSWLGHPVSMVCFDFGKKETLFLFVLDRDAFPDGAVPGSDPNAAQVKKLGTVGWSQGHQIFLLAGPTDPDSLTRFLALTKG